MAKRHVKRIRKFAGLFLLLLTGVMAGAYLLVEKKTQAAMFTVETAPPCKVVVVPGCIRFLANGQENLFFRYRIQTALELVKAGKAEYILVSGDNSRKEYDEASDMRDALMERGIPASKITLDYAGFSTLDSVVRAHKVFGQQRFLVVSQAFHAKRAVFIGQSKGLEVFGVAARDVPGRYSTRVLLREVAARVKMGVDLYVLRRSPKFLGEPVSVGSAS